MARGVAPPQVIEVLERVAANHPGIRKEPVPQAYVVNFASATVSFKLRAWTERYEDWVRVHSDLSVAVDEALTHEKMKIA